MKSSAISLLVFASLAAGQADILVAGSKDPIALCRSAFLLSHIDFLIANGCSNGNVQPCPKYCAAANSDRFVSLVSDHAADKEECKALTIAEFEAEKSEFRKTWGENCSVASKMKGGDVRIPTETLSITSPTEESMGRITSTTSEETAEDTSNGSSKTLAIALGVAIGVVVFIIILVVSFWLRKKHKRKRANNSTPAQTPVGYTGPNKTPEYAYNQKNGRPRTEFRKPVDSLGVPVRPSRESPTASSHADPPIFFELDSDGRGSTYSLGSQVIRLGHNIRGGRF